MLILTFFSIFMMPLTVGLGEETVLESTREWELFFDYLLLIHLPLMLLTAMEDDADQKYWSLRLSLKKYFL